MLIRVLLNLISETWFIFRDMKMHCMFRSKHWKFLAMKKRSLFESIQRGKDLHIICKQNHCFWRHKKLRHQTPKCWFIPVSTPKIPTWVNCVGCHDVSWKLGDHFEIMFCDMDMVYKIIDMSRNMHTFAQITHCLLMTRTASTLRYSDICRHRCKMRSCICQDWYLNVINLKHP